MEKIYKEASRKSGTYKLTNKSNKRVYVGSCKRFKTRWHQHEQSLFLNKHQNRFLQADFNKCGSGVFIFEVIEIIEGDKQARLVAEQLLLDQYYDGGKQCYNLRKSAFSPDGKVFSKTPEETRKKMSDAKKGYVPWIKGKKHTEETRQKMCVAKENVSDETRHKMSAAAMGRVPWSKGKTGVYSQEVLEHWSEIRKGRECPMKGKHHTEEAKQKIGAIHKGKKHTEETKRKMRENNGMKGKKYTLEERQKMSEARKGRKRPEKTGMRSARAKVYENIKLLSPDGVLYTKIECLAEFCRTHNLYSSYMCALFKGKVKSHKGWKLIV